MERTILAMQKSLIPAIARLGEDIANKANSIPTMIKCIPNYEQYVIT
jgi:hypothetical protein